MLRCINGLETIQGGDILLDGKSITGSKKDFHLIRQKIGMVFQSYDLFPHLDILQNLILGPVKAQGRNKEEVIAEAEKLLDRVGLLDKKHSFARQLSGGQKQRVAIAGIIALRPTIIILDEATSMLDPEGREDLMAVMRELQKKFQLTIISITHDLSEIALSDRTLVFQKGKLESSMTPRELFSRNDLNEIGLDKPFSKQVQESLSSHFPLKQDYLTESELLDQLWEFL